MDERQWWIELEARINMADSDDFKEIKLTFDETREIVELLKKLDEMLP